MTTGKAVIDFTPEQAAVLRRAYAIINGAASRTPRELRSRWATELESAAEVLCRAAECVAPDAVELTVDADPEVDRGRRAESVLNLAKLQTAERGSDRVDTLRVLLRAAARHHVRDCGLPPDALPALLLAESAYA